LFAIYFIVILMYFKVMQSWIFSIITPVSWSFRNHSNMLFWYSRNIFFYYYQYGKQFSCL